MRISTDALSTVVALAMVAAAAIGAAVAPRPAPAAALTLVYVGADDCPPCVAWQRGPRAALLGSRELAGVVLREVKSPTLFALGKDEHWPEDLRGLRRHLPAGVGVPLWFILSDGKPVAHAHGARAWGETLLPHLLVMRRAPRLATIR